MVKQVEAELVLSGKDKTAKLFTSLHSRMARAERQAAAFNRKQHQIAAFDKSIAKAERAYSLHRRAEMGAMISGTGSRLIAGTVGGALAGMGVAAAITSYADLERQMTRIGLAAGASDEETKAATRDLAQYANELALPFDQVVAGLDSLVATGKSLPEALAFLPAILRTAQATGAATDDMSASAAALATSLKVSAGEMQVAFDQLVVGGQLGQFELKDMAQYLPSLTASAAKLGFVGLEGNQRLVAMLQTVRQVSGTSAEAATAVGDAIEKTLSPTVANAFKKRGVNIGKVLEDAAKRGENQFEAVIKVLRKLTSGMSETERNMFISSIYTDKEARRAVTAMMTLADEYDRYKTEIGKAAGATEANLQRVLADSKASVDRLANSWNNLWKTIGRGADAIGSSTIMDKIAGAIGLGIDLAESEEKRKEFALVQSQIGHRNRIADATEDIFQKEREIAAPRNSITPSEGDEEGLEPWQVALRRNQSLLANDDTQAKLEAELASAFEKRALAVAAAQWDALDRGFSVSLPRWMQEPEPPTGRKDGVPFPISDPRRGQQPFPDLGKMFPASGLPAGDPARAGWTDVAPAPSAPAGPDWGRAPSFDNPLIGSADALRDAMEAGGEAASTDIKDGATAGADALNRAADRLEQALRNGAAALSSVRIPMPVPSPMRGGSSGPNANLGQSMPNAGITGQ